MLVSVTINFSIMGHCHESGANVGPTEITNLLFLFLKF